MNKNKTQDNNQSNRSSRQKQQISKQQRIKHHRHTYRSSMIHKLFTREQYHIQGLQSQSFNRREYQLPIQTLKKVKKSNIGFTNNILYQKNETKKLINLYVPAYVSIKLKSIHQIQINNLIAQINCSLIISLLVDGLSQQIKKMLQSSITIQINRGESYQLAVKEDSSKILLKRDNKFIKFIIRDAFPVQIDADIFLSPFQILNLMLTMTINSIFVPPQLSIDKDYKQKISFNCMRNPQKTAISYNYDCNFGVYDLVHKNLAHYPSNLATYEEVKEQFIKFAQGKKKINKHSKKKHTKHKKYNISSPRDQSERLQLKDWSSYQKKLVQKIKYFQYSHFTIPLYKYPGNSWSTIFIPVIMLALLSISLFFNKSSFIQKIGLVATIVLGFIALIPSIKSELPPSQKITLSQSIVYMETINCMLSLTENMFKQKSYNWKNTLFYISVFIHIVCIGTAFSLLALHKFWWEPRYNIYNKPLQLGPNDDKEAWNNPYCDQYFITENQTNSYKVQKYHCE